MTTKTGSEIEGYRLGEPLSHGRMSDVYIAERESDSKRVVLKIASEEASDQMKQRLVREYRLLCEVDHPNIVRSLDHGFVGDRPYLVLEHVDGETLRDRLVSGKPMPWNQLAWIIEQVGSALSTLHGLGILHRDVKPENVLIDRIQRVKLIDLSIGTEVSTLGDLTCQGEFLGTVDYMAPEQRHRLQVDQRVDQYSLAAMAFEMLTGHCCLGQFRSPSELNARLSKNIDRVILKALERDPEERYRSIDEFTHAFLEAGKQSQPNRSWLVVAACAIFIALTLAVNHWVGSREQDSSSGELIAARTTDSRKSASQQAAETARPTVNNSLGMRLVQIPAGEFEMGVEPEEIEASTPFPVPPHVREVSSPKHRVELSKPIWIGAHEVTVAQFRAFVEATGYRTTGERWVESFGVKRFTPLWNAPARYELQDDHPVTAVSWFDASEFCRWLSEREGVTYRLPTEAEWEYACRAGTSGLWSCDKVAYSEHAVHGLDWNRGPLPVGQLKPNPWGLFDMHGNVHEWCQDQFSLDYYSDSPDTDPVCDRAAGANEVRVLRGGGYKAPPHGQTCAMRRGHLADDAHCDTGHAIGFRIIAEQFPPRLANRGSR